MHLSQILLVVVASLLATSEALSTATIFNQVEKTTSLGSQRLLRTHPDYKVADDEAETEERGPLSREQMKALVKEVGIDRRKVKADFNHLLRHEKYPEYQRLMNNVLEKQRSKGAPVYKNP
ncbi:Avr1b-1 avirulence-like protein [Phytophthora sojae]|uniref:RxLR effector protein n=2 Tax=Phytophthora sojae TaxID=67593 RepID=G5A2B8_PHYSP|nr:Avr1b-1 avirulence-like protein [Phytophthora sojae]AEK80651.1 Avh96 [Phytophthora sojae]AEK80652.1 Avh96 [Phytophthora sojae]AEK80653.1 Avh96 [Phytophthora sojae]EGZ09809.1 Avr1b-1 avirulence-like protein [Phytophthora sojae]|eukprot:XP_009534670.1 Avr1b-1 avirulence-like protein [Phytophthora sojae]